MNTQFIGHGYAGAYTLQQFCAAHGVSRSALYLLLKDGRGPRTFKVGRRTFITTEAAADWRHRMESESAEVAA